MAFDYRKFIDKHEGQIVAAIQLGIIATSIGGLVKPDKTAKKLKKAEYKELSKQKKLNSKIKMKEKKALAKSKKKANLSKEKARLKKLKLKNKLAIERDKAKLREARRDSFVYSIILILN